mgnify:CR=1 FL=1
MITAHNTQTHPITSLSPYTTHLLPLNQVEDTLEVDALGPLDGQTQSTIPDELGERAKTTRDTKGGGVVQGLSEAVVVEEYTGRRVDVRIGVLGLAVLLEDLRGDLGVAQDELEDGVGSDAWAGGGVIHKGLEARVRLAQDGVAVAGHDTAAVEGLPEVAADILVGVVLWDGLLHLEDPAEHLLRGETANC